MVLIPVYHGKEFLERSDLRAGRVAMPFHIGPMPENPPDSSGLDKGGPGHRAFQVSVRIVPDRAYLKQLKAWPNDAETQVQFLPQIGRRSTFLEEGVCRFFNSSNFKFAESHSLRPAGNLDQLE